MKEIKQFLQNFLKNQGHYVFISLLLGKICAFLSSIYIIRLIPEQDFGKISIVAALFAVFSSCSGFGSAQSLLRFGSVAEDKMEKSKLSAYLLRKGFLYQLILTLIFLVVSVFFVQKYEDIFWIFLFFSVRLIGFFYFLHIQSDLRINNKNREFARINNVVNVLGLVILLVLSYYFQLAGYLIAMAVTPFLSLFWFKKDFLTAGKLSGSFDVKELWKYAWHTSGTALLSDALFSVDIILLGFLMNENAVANYRISILIPSNITFLSLAFMQSDFPVLAKNYTQKAFLKKYISDYYKLFIPVCFIIFILAGILSKDILRIFFDERYTENSFLFIIFMFMFLMNILFRNLYGNLLSAVGKMEVNTKASLFSLLLIIVLAFLLVPEFGILGMTLSVGITLMSSGFILGFFFHNYLKKLK
ncbi:oligosaccharide flippase family protein [Chryseobacterium sp. CT-SW4]|uniref:oligosaccharide flippase family protein n=1 Tax=Chryseobacterium sp. SW-1 TaxID=3157343 RepID=UPI003B02B871